MKKNISYLIAMALVATFSSCQQDLVSMEPVPLNQTTSSLAVADSVQTFKVIPSASIETDRLQFRAAHNEMQATGFYVAPNSTYYYYYRKCEIGYHSTPAGDRHTI